jgi:hypothetical protein
MSMATPLEVRVPILGHRFMGWIASLPVSLKFHNLGRKYILKQLAERVGVPPQVLYPLKQGFAFLLAYGMSKQLMLEGGHQKLLEARGGYLLPSTGVSALRASR